MTTNKTNNNRLRIATTALAGMGFSYSVFAFGVFLEDTVGFFVFFFFGADLVVDDAGVCFFVSETNFSARLEVFF